MFLEFRAVPIAPPRLALQKPRDTSESPEGKEEGVTFGPCGTLLGFIQQEEPREREAL